MRGENKYRQDFVESVRLRESERRGTTRIAILDDWVLFWFWMKLQPLPDELIDQLQMKEVELATANQRARKVIQ